MASKARGGWQKSRARSFGYEMVFFWTNERCVGIGFWLIGNGTDLYSLWKMMRTTLFGTYLTFFFLSRRSSCAFFSSTSCRSRLESRWFFLFFSLKWRIDYDAGLPRDSAKGLNQLFLLHLRKKNNVLMIQTRDDHYVGSRNGMNRTIFDLYKGGFIKYAHGNGLVLVYVLCVGEIMIFCSWCLGGK